MFKLILNKRFKNEVKKHKIKTPEYFHPLTLFDDVKETIFKKFKEEKRSKVRFSMHCLMVKTNEATGEETRKDLHFSSKQETILEGTDLEETYKNMIVKIIDSMEKWKDESSKWRLEKIINLDLYLSKYNPLGGSSYIPLSSYLKNKKAIINMKNNDENLYKIFISIKIIEIK